MNMLILFDSQYGNTERIAQAMADSLHSFGQVRVERVDKAQPGDLGDLDLLVLGCPTQGWRETAAMRAFLASLSSAVMRGLVVACFDTRFHKPRWLTGSAAWGMAKRLRKMGCLLLGPPESFFVKGGEGPLEDGELERAEIWALTLHDKVAQSGVVVSAA